MVASTSAAVSTLVQSYLRSDSVAGDKVRVVADEVRRGDTNADWWWVPVAFQVDPQKLYYYYQLFSAVEDRLEKEEHVNVLLVPRVTETIGTAQ